MTMDNLYYTPKEVAEQLKLRVHTVYDYIRQGRLPAVRLGNRCRIARADLEAFLAGRRTRAGSSDPEKSAAIPRSPSAGRPPAAGAEDADIAGQIERNQAARRLLAEWLADASGYDEQVWPTVERLIEENPISLRAVPR
jgi:excisionase family DNA binding protein